MTPGYYTAPRKTNVAEWFTYLEREIPWEDHTPVRRECFLSSFGDVAYTYGSGRGERTYTSIPMLEPITRVQAGINGHLGVSMNVCFLNYYRGEHDHLGWHADDHPGTDHTQPICVVSFGAPREIWWRFNGETGIVPPERRKLLAAGSLFVMPPGFQQDYQHRIPKSDRPVGPRISLTFRSFLRDPLAPP